MSWSRDLDDPERWFLVKSRVGTGLQPDHTVSVTHPGRQVGELPIIFPSFGSFQLVAVADLEDLDEEFDTIDMRPFTTFEVQVMSKGDFLDEPTPTSATLVNPTAIPTSVYQPLSDTPSTSLLSLPTSESTTSDQYFNPSSESEDQSLPFNPSSTTSSTSENQSRSFSPSSTSEIGSNASTNIPKIVGGSIGAVVLLVVILLASFCWRRMKRNSRITKEITKEPYWIDKTSQPGFSYRRSSGSEVALVGGDSEVESSATSAPTDRNVRIPVSRQYRSVGRTVSNRTKILLEKTKRRNERQKISDQSVHGDDEGISHLPALASKAQNRPASVTSERTPNILRHLDSGMRIIQFYGPEKVHEPGMAVGSSKERQESVAIVENTIELPPEYTFV
ncbi:hypothetical protein K435DRAFT_870461 [Dendrothele bispora CBS 962.96]|uniref:Uncharacterized protein n=1 Tax=Dendrothele bispora (strain CBS 962.96) TaxID=1314807 RepID=A0A4S8L7W3_DENBC|nr:hypothetical protein K435DRAFT_870461 [Dendrothele bispora CBS 962.96]